MLRTSDSVEVLAKAENARDGGKRPPPGDRIRCAEDAEVVNMEEYLFYSVTCTV